MTTTALHAPIDVDALLHTDVLQRAEANAVAGREHLHRRIRWVHISEQRDIASFLKGGELMLTTGMALRDEDACCRYIANLAAVGAAGVVVRTSPSFPHFPAGALSLADELGLPLVEMRHRVSFIEITETVHKEILNQQFSLIEHAAAVGNHFMDLLARDAGLRAVLDALATFVENPVVLENPAHQLVEFAPHGAAVAAVLSAWHAHRPWDHVGENEPAACLAYQETACAWVQMSIRGENWGWMHVLALQSEVNDATLVALDNAARAVALTLQREGERRHLGLDMQDRLIKDIVSGRFANEEGLLQAARAQGIDLSGRRLVPLAVLPPVAPLHHKGEIGEARALQARLTARLRQALLQARVTALTGFDGEHYLAIAGLAPEQEGRKEAEALALAVRQRMAQLARGSFTIGIGRDARPVDLVPGFEQALEAAYYARDIVHREVCHFDDLGLHHLLVKLNEGPELATFVQDQLGALLAAPSPERERLLKTLRVFLEEGRSKTRAARTLGVERRTLYNRLERVAALLRCDLESSEASLRIWLALRSLTLVSGSHARAPES